MSRLKIFIYDLEIPIPMFRDLVALVVGAGVVLAVFKLATYAEISFQIGRMI